MALLQADLEQWIDAHGPFLYHATLTDEAACAIPLQGLVPWNQGPGGQLEDPWTPRVDHVYMGTAEALLAACAANMEGYLACGLFSVDLRGLDAASLNPDEDAFWSPLSMLKTHSFLLGDIHLMINNSPLYEDGVGLDDPFLNVADETMEVDLSEYPAGTVLAPLDERLYKSYGQWAEANDLGSDPAHTLLSLKEAGTVAYRGRIAPELVEQAAPNDHRHLKEFLKSLS